MAQIEPAGSASLIAARSKQVLKIDTSQTSVVKPVPTALINELRRRLEGTNAHDASQDRIVVGYLVATMGLSGDELDEKTQQVVEAFRKGDPMLTMVEEMVLALNKQSETMSRMHNVTSEIRGTIEAMELGQAYLLAESTGTLETAQIGPTTMDYTQTKVTGARKRLRDQALRLRKAEDAARGRPIR